MAASRTVRALAVLTLIAVPGLAGQLGARAAQPDSETVISLTTGTGDRILAFGETPPSNFASPNYNDASWLPATASPCPNPSWTLPEGASSWVWANSCFGANLNIVLRRTFTIPARSVLSARLWVAIHGAGVAFLNGRMVADSAGDPALVDVTTMLHPNGARNVLAIGAVQTDEYGNGITYNLQIDLSANQVAAYARAHQKPLPPGNGQPSQGTTGSGQTQGSRLPPIEQTGGQSAACATNPPAGVLPIYTNQFTNNQATTTGWVRQTTQQTVYIVASQIDTTRINVPTDMPWIQLNGQTVRASALAYDDVTGEQVLTVPATTNLPPLVVGQVHNQPVGQVALVTAYSRDLNCLATYQSHVLRYYQQPDGRRFAVADLVGYNNGSDNGVAFDAQGNLLGSITFNTTITDPQGHVLPLIAEAAPVLANVDTLIAVLNQQSSRGASQHVIAVLTNADGTQVLTRDGMPVNGTGGSSALATVTPIATTTP